MEGMLLFEVTDVVSNCSSLCILKASIIIYIYIFFFFMRANNYHVSPVVVGVRLLGKSVKVTDVVSIVCIQ